MAAPNAEDPTDELVEGAFGTELWTLDDACQNTFWSLDGGPGAALSLDELHGNWESAPWASGRDSGCTKPASSAAGAGSGIGAEGSSVVDALSMAQQGERRTPGEARARQSWTKLPESTAALASTAAASSAPWQPAGAEGTKSRASTPAGPQPDPSGFSFSVGPEQKRQDALDSELMQGSGARDTEDALLPPKVIGFVPQSHFVSILDHLFDRGVTLGIDRLLPSTEASSAQALAPLPGLDTGAGRLAIVGSPGTANMQEMALGADSPIPAHGQAAAAAPSSAPYHGVPLAPLVPGRDTGDDAVYTLSRLPPAVARKVFGLDLELEDLKSSGIGRRTSVPDEQGLPGAQLQGSISPINRAAGCSTMEMLWESTLRGIPIKDNQKTGEGAAVSGPLAMSCGSWADAVPLNERLASALTQIEVQGQPILAASRTRLLAGLPSYSNARDTHNVVVAATSEGDGTALQSLMAHELGSSMVNKRPNLGVDGMLNWQQCRLQRTALEPGHSLAASDEDASVLALTGSRNTSSPGNATSAWESTVLPLSVAMPRMNELERDFFLKQLVELAFALERKDMVRFKELYSRLHLHAKLRGRASERTIFHVLRSFICRKDGTGADFHNKRTRTSVQEMDNARKWYFTAHPAFIFLYFASAGPALLHLKGRRSIQIVTIGPVMQWPVLLRRLKQDPVDGVRLKRVRLTIINTWSLVCPQRIDLSTMRSLGLVGSTISEAAAGMGLEFSLRIVDVVDDSLDWFEAIDRRDDEALAVCTASELSFLHDDPQFCGGLRLRLFQALKDLRVDVFTIAENEVPGGSSPFFPQRLVGCFQFLWALLHSHDSLGIGNHRHARFVEHIVAELRVVNAVSTEGIQRRWRPMSGSQWHDCMLRWGFRPLKVEASALALMRGIVKSYPSCFQVDSKGSWIKLTWEGTTMYSASAWTV